MLRATTDPFKIVLMIVIALLGVLALIRARGKWKVGLPVLAAAIVVFMYLTESKFWGVVVMGSAVVSLFFLPWLDRSPVKSIRYRPLFTGLPRDLRRGVPDPRVPRHAAAIAGLDADRAGLCADLLRVLPRHARLDAAWHVQAAAGAGALQAPLT